MSARTKLFAACVAVAAFGSACGIPIWTEAVRGRYSLTPEEMRRVQFFTSAEIVLRREVGGQEKVIGGEGLQVRDGERQEEIVIPAKTPAVAIRVEQNCVLVSFSRQRPDLALWFGVKGSDMNLPPEMRRFELLPLANSPSDPQPFTPVVGKGFLLNYGGKKYRVADARAWSVHLLYELDERFEKDRVREEPPGWRVKDGVYPSTTPAASASAGVHVTLPALPAPSAP